MTRPFNKSSAKKYAGKNTTKPGEHNSEGFLNISLVNQGVTTRKRKSCPLKAISVSEITYKNIKLLNKFLSERGRIISRRFTNVELKKQRALSEAIKQARHLALISPIKKEM